jgi:hypothetical protein
VEAPQGRPFHQVARNEAHRWWRPLAGSLAVLVVGMGSVLLLMFAGMIVKVAVTGELPDTGGTDTNSIFGDA